MSTDVSATIKTYPRLPYDRMKRAILGDSYALSLVFIGAKRAESLNKKYRKKTYVPNVLSFPLTKDAGEIYITPAVAKREADKRGMTVRGYIGFLFIHGLLHLKGHRHGATMERAEKKYISKFSLR